VPKKLVIVESPAKARTIARYLGSGYVVESSVGHVRDLPRKAGDVPAGYKQEPWARLGVDVDNDFKPLYVVPSEKKKQITKLRSLLKQADELYLATDEDREGESIAWHLTEVLSPKVPVRRMVFHEITPEAIRRAVNDPRDLDRRLVDAQEARRRLDRLFGYAVSPVLWKMVRTGLSAGRVQSPAIRILVQRERERIEFRAASFWDVEGTFVTGAGERFGATLVAIDGTRLAVGKDFDEAGEAAGNVLVLDEEEATRIAAELADAAFAIRSVERKPWKRSPYAPFRTSTLQQEAGRKLRFGSQRTMRVAQRLYENGYITYMRTDSTALSEAAVASARSEVAERYGAEYLPRSPRVYRTKVKNAQEAHEAIRPAGDRFRSPEQVAREVERDEARLYDLIWKRTIASQMADATGESVAVRLGGPASSGRDAEFATSGRVIGFPGFLRAYVEGSDDPDADLEDKERRLPVLVEGEAVTAEELGAKGHETKPPARFTEASLVKRLEELGIGRPSTYASIIQTILEREYAWKKATSLVPTFTAFAAVTLLEQHFPNLVDFDFTARMEDDLDRIAAGSEEAIPWLSRFYFGNGYRGLKVAVTAGLGEIDAREINSISIGEDSQGRSIVARVGRYGPYVQRGDDSATIPDDLPPDELTVERAEELLAAPNGGTMLGTDPETGLEVLVRSGRFGPYVQLGDAGESRPKTASLFSGMAPDTVTLEDALRLLSLPRALGLDPESGEEIVALNGRYGPYLKRGSQTRSLEAEEELFAVTLEQALQLFAQPKRRRGSRGAAPLRELGVDPATGCIVVVRDGRFGPYVTDGSVNASLRRSDGVESITIERAAELLEQRRERMRAEGKEIKPCRTPED
jgi:DNA topoisomerase-1